MKLAEVSIETLNAWVDAGYMTPRDYAEEIERRSNVSICPTETQGKANRSHAGIGPKPKEPVTLRPLLPSVLSPRTQSLQTRTYQRSH